MLHLCHAHHVTLLQVRVSCRGFAERWFFQPLSMLLNLIRRAAAELYFRHCARLDADEVTEFSELQEHQDLLPYLRPSPPVRELLAELHGGEPQQLDQLAQLEMLELPPWLRATVARMLRPQQQALQMQATQQQLETAISNQLAGRIVAEVPPSTLHTSARTEKPAARPSTSPPRTLTP